jgi:antitoxin component YwqK of YwqJK toxin-antitoxin module
MMDVMRISIALAVTLLIACAKKPPPKPRVECPVGTTETESWDSVGCKRPDGTWHGPFVAMYEGGKINKTGAFKDGVFDGAWQVFARDGRVLGTFEVVDGTGVVIDWHASGTKASEATYRNGKIDGVQRTWHPNGVKAIEASYRDGRQHGVATQWAESGTKITEETYEDGRRHGEAKTWEPASGELVAEAVYTHGTRVRQTTYAGGKVTSTAESRVPEPGTRIATRDYQGIDPAWQTCERHDECELIATTCCACGAGDHVAVNYRHLDEASKAIKTDCAKADCPEQRCNMVSGRCDAGRCTSAE